MAPSRQAPVASNRQAVLVRAASCFGGAIAREGDVPGFGARTHRQIGRFVTKQL